MLACQVFLGVLLSCLQLGLVLFITGKWHKKLRTITFNLNAGE